MLLEDLLDVWGAPSYLGVNDNSFRVPSFKSHQYKYQYNQNVTTILISSWGATIKPMGRWRVSPHYNCKFLWLFSNMLIKPDPWQPQASWSSWRRPANGLKGKRRDGWKCLHSGPGNQCHQCEMTHAPCADPSLTWMDDGHTSQLVVRRPLINPGQLCLCLFHISPILLPLD